MKVLIVSDTHRRNGNLQEVIERTAPFDMLIHLGDAEGSEDLITAWCMEQNQDCQVHMVLGNNDFFSCLDREKEIAIGPHRAFLTHGHFTACLWERSAWKRRQDPAVWISPCLDTLISRIWRQETG